MMKLIVILLVAFGVSDAFATTGYYHGVHRISELGKSSYRFGTIISQILVCWIRIRAHVKLPLGDISSTEELASVRSLFMAVALGMLIIL